MSEKPQLPFGWVVKQSKSYPDRVYYFNINTGASTWEFPDLIKDYSVNPAVAGPVSPPILSAGLLKASPILPAGQSLQKQHQEAAFSPQFSEDESSSDKSPAPLGKQPYGRPNDKLPLSSYQRQDKGNMPDETKRRLQYSSSASECVRYNDGPGLLAARPFQTSQNNVEQCLPKSGSVHSNPEQLGCTQSLTSASQALGHGHYTPKSKILPFHGYSARAPSSSEPKKISVYPTFGRINDTPEKCSKSQTHCSKMFGREKLNRSFGASGSQSYNDNRSSHLDLFQQKSSSVKISTNSGSVCSPYDKALKMLNKSVEKSLTHLGQHGADQGPKADKSTKVSLETSLSKQTCVHSSISEKETLEKELNKTLEREELERELNKCLQRKSLEKVLNKSRERKALERELNKALEKDFNDNFTKTGKRRLDGDRKETDVKKKKFDESVELVVKHETKRNCLLRSPDKKSESKGVKRKSSEILKRDSELIDDSSDRRKVIKSSAADNIVSRNVVLKNTPLKLGTNSAVPEDLKVQTSVNLPEQNALSSSRSFTRQDSDDSNLSLEFPGDLDQSGILRQFIGDKDKLLSIQSWIDNLQEGAGSSNVSLDSFSESLSGDGDDRRVVVSDKSTDCDSGYLSPPLKPAVRTERGWPGEVKKSDISAREISAMEIDDIDLPESDVKFEEEDMVIDLMLSEVREQMKSNPEKVCGTLTTTVAELQEFMKEQAQLEKGNISTAVHSQSEKKLYITIDTNVIISDLPFVQDLKDQEITGYGKPVLYIPWIVLQELDSLKQAQTKGMPKLTAATQNKASRGIKMLQHMFQIKHPQVKGQTPMESQEAARMFRAECNDDIILMTCLHHKQKDNGADVVLLTNDNNLINKALVCGITAYNRKDLLSGLEKLRQKASASSQSDRKIPLATPDMSTPLLGMPIPGSLHSNSVQTRQGLDSLLSDKSVPGPSTSVVSDSIAQTLPKVEKCYTSKTLAEDIHSKFKTLLKTGLGKVLQSEMELAYSDMWREIVFRKPPWSLRDILDSVKKHWIAVFGMVFKRPQMTHIDYLIKNFGEDKVYSIDELSVCIKEALSFLDACVKRNLYGSAFIGVVDQIQQLQNLCDSVSKGEITVQSISSLDNYLTKQPSSHPQTVCDNSNENTYLVNNNLPKTKTAAGTGSGIRNSSPAQPNPAGGNASSMDTSATVSIVNQLAQRPQSWELAVRKLQKIWQHIFTCCDEMRKLLDTRVDERVLSAVEATLSLLVPAAKQLLTEYTVVLQLPLSHLPGHMDKIGNLANHCNNFFSSLKLNDEDPPVDAENFLALFRNGQQRQSLTLFLSQLDEMLCHLYKCMQHLDPGD